MGCKGDTFTSPSVGLTPPGLATQMPAGQMPATGATDYGPEHYTDT